MFPFNGTVTARTIAVPNPGALANKSYVPVASPEREYAPLVEEVIEEICTFDCKASTVAPFTVPPAALCTTPEIVAFVVAPTVNGNWLLVCPATVTDTFPVIAPWGTGTTILPSDH
jgi:hypothetical protein